VVKQWWLILLSLSTNERIKFGRAIKRSFTYTIIIQSRICDDLKLSSD
jgi:hypothetical protein